MRYWWTSDTHFGHDNIRRYCNRPFSTLDEMNSKMIVNWNSRVKKEDTVFFLGDFCFKNSAGGKKGEGTQVKSVEWENKLNGKIIFIKGNHDKNNSTKTIIENMVIIYGGRRIFMCHKPEHFNKKYPITFCGHVHEKWKVKQVGNVILYNVGVDVNKFAPVSFEEIMKNIHKWKREK